MIAGVPARTEESCASSCIRVQAGDAGDAGILAGVPAGDAGGVNMISGGQRRCGYIVGVPAGDAGGVITIRMYIYEWGLHQDMQAVYTSPGGDGGVPAWNGGRVNSIVQGMQQATQTCTHPARCYPPFLRARRITGDHS